MMISKRSLINHKTQSLTDTKVEYGVVRYDLANDFHPMMSEYSK